MNIAQSVFLRMCSEVKLEIWFKAKSLISFIWLRLACPLFQPIYGF